MSFDDEKKSTIEVKDKRHFNLDGSVKEEGAAAEEEKAVAPEHEAKPAEEKTETPPPPHKDFEINFSTFVLSLASSIQINLGLIAHPMTKKAEVDLVSAKQTIDILGMMDEKTKGNLSKEEDQILKQILNELRIQYVEVSKKTDKK